MRYELCLGGERIWHQQHVHIYSTTPLTSPPPERWLKAGDSTYWDPKDGGSGYSRDNIFYFERNGKIMEWTRQGSHRPTTHQTWLSMPLDFKLTWDHGYRPADTEFNVRFGSTHNPDPVNDRILMKIHFNPPTNANNDLLHP